MSIEELRMEKKRKRVFSQIKLDFIRKENSTGKRGEHLNGGGQRTEIQRKGHRGSGIALNRRVK